ncbi:MAG: TonB-dependent receptor [Prolixibacteraceae bacterium]|nr:TonB-dependent receptor [Prolixibacteraceae bacterium]
MKLKLFLLTLWMLAAFVNAMAQQITGQVRASGGEALPGVTVLEKNTTNGISTDLEGHFIIKASANATLVFSYVGFQTQEIPVQGRSNINVILEENLVGIDEVVAIGYGSALKKDITGAVATVSESEFNKGYVTNAEQLIANKLPGVQVIPSSGRPGAGSSFLIRGGASLNASNDPLIVIDGVPIEGWGDGPGFLSALNPNDIESFSILKDASAAAIYGSRASNGVILITTTKGQAGKLKVSIQSKASLSHIMKKVPVLDGDQFRELVSEAAAYSGKDLSWFAPGTENTDWQDEIFQQALSTDHNLSISGGIKNLPYRLSLAYLNQDGILKTSNFERVTAIFNLNPTLFDQHLKINLNLKASMEDQRLADERAIGSAISFDPTQPVRTDDSKFGGYFEYEAYADNPAVFWGHFNPVGMLEQVTSTSNTLRSIGNIQLDYSLHFLPELHININTGYDLARSKSSYFMPETAFEQNMAKGSKYNADPSREVRNVYFESYMNYVKDLKSLKSRVDAMVGYSYNDFLSTYYNYPSYNALGEEQPNSAPTYLFDKPQHTLISFYARANYFLMDRYLLTATIRNDGSSRFAESNRWGLFPSVAFAWKINQEGFMQGMTSLSDLKLRMGYGVTGQQDGIGNYDYIPTYSQGELTAQYYIGNKFYRLAYPSAADRNRKWEQTATYNLGLDWGFFNQRLSGSIDVYKKITDDLLNTVNVPMGTDFTSSITKNIGSMENRGIELNLKATAVKTNDLSWNLGANFTYNENEITKLSLVADSAVGLASGSYLVNTVGYSRNVFYLYHQVYDQDGTPLEETMLDVNKDGIINDKDRYRSHSSIPKFLIGFNTALQYKSWSLNVNCHANLGHYMYYRPGDNMVAVYGWNAPYNVSTNWYDTEFKMSTNQAQEFSDYYLQNASFLKVDNITIAYDFKNLFEKASLRINASIQNVYTLTNYQGQDPEASWNWGVDFGSSYPVPRTYAIGLTLDF